MGPRRGRLWLSFEAIYFVGIWTSCATMNNQNRRFLIFLILLASFYQGHGVSAEELNAYTYQKKMAIKKTSPGNPVLYPVIFFTKFISGVDGNRCPMYPTCSRYAVEAIEKHGVLMGWVMTCDRLIRCGRDETRLSPPVWIKGAKHTYDPVDANDFWWKK